MIAKWAVVILVSVALVGAAVGWAASLTVGGVDDLGSGSASVDAPPGVQVTDVEWFLDPGDSSKVARVDVTFAGIDPGITVDIYLALKDTSGNDLRSIALLSEFIDGGFGTTLSWVMVNPSTQPTNTVVPAADITEFAITVTQAVP